MAYQGNSPAANFQSLPAVQRFNGTGSATAFTLASVVANDQSILVSVDGVTQDSNAYAVSGTTLTFTAAPSSGTGNIFVNTISPVGSTVVPPDGSVTTAKLAAGVLLSWQAVQTSAFTAVAGRGYPCNTTSSAFTVTLPSSASAGDSISIVDYSGTFNTNTITLTSSLNIEGAAYDKLLTTNREGVTITYADATQGWIATSGVNSGDQALDLIPADFLVIAGGAGGGANTNSAGSAGGGGAGGYRTSTQTVPVGTAITVTVGDGGAGGASGSNVGVNGSNSSISGSSLTTITSTGGGGGGSGAGGTTNGSNGGSGGGTGYTGSAGGSGNTPSTSPSQGNSGGVQSVASTPYGGAGGGGAGAVGVSGHGGAGGAGTASSITGSSVTRAGGGGGGNENAAGGTGGSGGGGNGGQNAAGNAGTVNTGGGGGGSGGVNANAGGAGGKGVVILSVPTARYSSTTTGSPTVTTSGSNTIMVFTGSGSYTA